MKAMILFLTLLPLDIYAHCPSSYGPQKLCLMLKDNVIYIYDAKNEHNGPYQDFAKGTILQSVAEENNPLQFTRLARGVFKINQDKNSPQLT